MRWPIFPRCAQAAVLRRTSGGLVEIYSMTDGGVVCLLMAHARPDKLHTEGIPWAGDEVFTIDEEGNRLPPDSTGELVGRSVTMMNGYQKKPAGMMNRARSGNAWAILAVSMQMALLS